jgi:hypothetical protein
MGTVIDALYDQNHQALLLVANANEISIASDLDNKLKKHLVMAATSYFETEVRQAIEGFASSASENNPAIISLIKQKAIERQYHTYFDWDKRNANKFFSHFGESFSARCKQDVQTQKDLAEAIAAFLELGEMRNKLAHLNFALYPIEKTSDEIYELYNKATRFLHYIKTSLVEASSSAAAKAAPASQESSS